VSPAVRSELTRLILAVNVRGWVVKQDPTRRGIVFEPVRAALPPEAHELMDRELDVWAFLEERRTGTAPLIEGGQGRTDDEVRSDARAVGFVLGLAAVVLGICIGVVCLKEGRWPWELFQ
jgi:hypothetical protein